MKNIHHYLSLHQVLIFPNGNKRSLIASHHNKYNKNEKAWNIATITKMWHRDTRWANDGETALMSPRRDRHKTSFCKKHSDL